MNVLARINAGSNHPIVPDPVKEPAAVTPPSAPSMPNAAPAATQRAPLGSPRNYAGPSIISSALVVVGRLESAGDIQIDGKVEGDIRGQAVRIGNTAVVKGTVMGELVELAGTLEGKIEARSAVLQRTARMTGDIVHQTLQVDEGSSFSGSSRPNYGK
jgi:cytoskeletal protein CcmA (bactofilin family)